MLETIVTSVIVATITAIATYWIQERKLRTDPRTEFMAEQAVKQLLESPEYKKRSFDAIKRRLVGFRDDELRKILVRAGAVCFEDEEGKELWGLISKNKNAL